MADKEDLIKVVQEVVTDPQRDPDIHASLEAADVTEKPAGASSPPPSKEEEKETSTSSTQAETTPSSSSSKIEEKGKEKDAKPETSSHPSLYQKFVTSFDAVLQNLVSEEEATKQKLPSLDIEGVANFIKEDMPRNIIFMVGAGISTSAGIPDFRTPGTGLYDNLQKFNLPDPQAIFDLSFFRINPEPFYVLARDLFHVDIKPTPCHYFIRLMEEKGLLRRCYTQNIDTLEYTAGIKDDRIVTAHGSHQSSTCQKSSCKKKYNKEWFMTKISDKEQMVAKCDSCGGVVKPDIVFFGEKLPNRFFSLALTDFPKCDLLIIMGTSLVVQPFASMVEQVPKDTPRLLINLEPVGQGHSMFGGSGCLQYGQKDNIRDVYYNSTCDDGAFKLARLLGWEDELKGMINKEK